MDDRTPDGELIKRYLKGDEKSFAVLYGRYRLQLYAYLSRRVSCQADADDLFEECWLRVIKNLDRYQDDGIFGAWLLRVARNLWLDRLRSDRRSRMSVPLDDADAVPVEPAAPEKDRPDRVSSADELAELVRGALDELRPELREVFVLRQENRPFREIAEIQNCSINTVLSRMQYALKFLRRRLRSYRSTM